MRYSSLDMYDILRRL